MTVDKPTRIIYIVITGKPLKRLAVTFYVFIIFIITVHVATVGRLFFLEWRVGSEELRELGIRNEK